MFPRHFIALAVLASLFAHLTSADDYAWQQDHAVVLPTGELEYAPEPFTYAPVGEMRYIDFENGDDAHPGTQAQPWKHHPWDPDATGNAGAYPGGPTTYVFKQGVAYRGRLEVGGDAGQPGAPIILTRDPDWGEGAAAIYGSTRIAGGWSQGAHAEMPLPGQVWHIDLDFLPRRVWWVDDEDAIQRLHLAREPDWEESDPQDVTAEWWRWQQPAWWVNGLRGHTVDVGGKTYHLGIDEVNLVRPDKDDYLGAFAWTNWGIVDGSPFASKITHYGPGNEDENTSQFHHKQYQGVNIGGPWFDGIAESLIRNHRYYLEDRPWMLDQAGEFWFEKSGSGGRLYVWLPEDRDPNTVTLEAARHPNLIQGERFNHLEIAGLTFRFNNVYWELDHEGWWKETQVAAILLQGLHPDHPLTHDAGGEGAGIVVRHNVFEHVSGGVFLRAGRGREIDAISIRDNRFRHTDHEAIVIDQENVKNVDDTGRIFYSEILRNEFYRIGWRNKRGARGHAVRQDAQISLTAGNFLDRIAGWGIAIYGGKRDGELGEEPLSRHLVFHNRVEDALLKTADWGQIETWQGGAFYIFNNVSVNPGGILTWKVGNSEPTPRFGFAYYLDGAFKNYVFNNIARGANNTLGSKYANTSALQGIIGFENTFFNNTFHKFVSGSRQQAPGAGRYKYLANVWSDISDLLWRHADPDGVADPNDGHFDQGTDFDLEHLAYHDNVLDNVTGDIGVFEEDGTVYPSLGLFADALAAFDVLAYERPAVVAPEATLQDPESGDMRPAPGHAAIGRSARVFAPWALHAPVGEWHFTRNNRDPARINDEHWYMLGYYAGRSEYKDTPRYPLTGVGVAAADYIDGPLEDWTQGALRLSGGAYCQLPHAELVSDFSVGGVNHPGTDRRTVDVDADSFLIEIFGRLDDDADGLLVGKTAAGGVGYSLAVVSGGVVLDLHDQEGASLSAAGPMLPQEQWFHLLVEVDRGVAEARFHLDGVTTGTVNGVPTGTLANDGDFQVGGGPGHPALSWTIDFLRVCRGTLADARTSIGELYAWQFDGPALRDFTGRLREPGFSAAGALDRPLADHPPDDSDLDGLGDRWEVAWLGEISVAEGSDDPYGSGRALASSYVHALDPTAWDTRGQVQVEVLREPESDWLRVVYRRAKNLYGGAWVIQTSSDLGAGPEGWTPRSPDGVEVIENIINSDPDGDGAAEVVVVWIAIDPDRPRLFLRLLSPSG